MIPYRRDPLPHQCLFQSSCTFADLLIVNACMKHGTRKSVETVHTSAQNLHSKSIIRVSETCASSRVAIFHASYLRAARP